MHRRGITGDCGQCKADTRIIAGAAGEQPVTYSIYYDISFDLSYEPNHYSSEDTMHQLFAGFSAARVHRTPSPTAGLRRRSGWRASHDDIGCHRTRRAGRKLGVDDLQLIILAHLGDTIAHGYDMIMALWRPLTQVLPPEPVADALHPRSRPPRSLGSTASSRPRPAQRQRHPPTQVARILKRIETPSDTMLAHTEVGRRRDGELTSAPLSNEGDPADDRAARLREARSRLRAALIERRGASVEVATAHRRDLQRARATNEKRGT